MRPKKYDFAGWATKNNLLCSDGRTIRKNAFKDDDGHEVPLVWQHQHNDPSNVLGHAYLENRDEGVRAYCTFNTTENGQYAKELVRNKDVTALSIWANKLTQHGGDVLHGSIKEVSLVLAGANPGALIDFSTIQHADGSIETDDNEATIYNGVEGFDIYDESISHADNEDDKKEKKEEDMSKDKTIKEVLDSFTEDERTLLIFLVDQAVGGKKASINISHADDDDEGDDNGPTLRDVYNNMSEDKKKVLAYVIALAEESKDESKDDDEGEDQEMKHNVFEQDDNVMDVLSHDDMQEVLNNAKRCGSFKAALDDYAENTLQLEHGINDIEMLFPEAKNLTDGAPAFVKRDDAWVTTVFNGVHKSPFSRVKTVFANITEDEARAKGYIKGKQKKEEVFGLLKRTTTPQTVYKLQKFDRDDVIDITDFDVVAWVKGEMRVMLNEEIARAVLVGDGRVSGAEDKINEQNIRPIWKDDDFYTIHKSVTIAPAATNYDKAEAIIEAALRARKDYKGSGTPDAFFDPDTITTMLLAKDTTGRRIYNSISDLASALRVKNIYEVPVFEGLEREDKQSKKHALLGIIVNLADYNIGADKGGSVNLFDDFDIDYNKFTYLIETRCSGALVRPYSAIVIETAPTE
nr:MAG TPA: major capsid protein [Caudoviricetes sp.]